jgi:hypothetical protein
MLPTDVIHKAPGRQDVLTLGGVLISVGCHEVSTESGSDRVSLSSRIGSATYCYPVATALGTAFITKLEHYLTFVRLREPADTVYQEVIWFCLRKNHT